MRPAWMDSTMSCRLSIVVLPSMRAVQVALLAGLQRVEHGLVVAERQRRALAGLVDRKLNRDVQLGPAGLAEGLRHEGNNRER